MVQDAYTSGGGAQRTVLLSVLSVAILGSALYFLGRSDDHADTDALTVWCAAGIRLPVEAVAQRYEEEFGVRVDLHFDNSGGLLSSIIVRPEGDLYIPADSSFVERGREKGVLKEAMPLAKFRLVVAVKQGNPRGIKTLDDLLRDDVRFAICSEAAGAGKKTRVYLERVGRWKEVLEGAKAQIPTVTNAASSVESSNSLDAALIWDATAKQHGLDVVLLPEFAPAVATIEVARLEASENSAAALRFARYLSSPEKGAPSFAQFGYEVVPGDAWAATPELMVFSGGVNREAVAQTLRDFEAREGCKVLTSFGGCGTLVGQIEARAASPALFLTCDASYMDMVQDLFLEASDVSETSIVLLTRKDSTISTLEDLAKEGVKLGITEPRASALGALSVALLEEIGIWERVKKNVRVHSPTAHELIGKMTASDALDVALVYEANCQNIPDRLRFVRVEHPKAKATQNMAMGKNTQYPFLVERLMHALKSETSRDRFTSHGFQWRVGVGGGL